MLPARHRLALSLSLGLVAGLAACDAVTLKPDVAPVDTATATTFARAFTAALESCDRAQLDALFDGNQFGRIAMEHADGPFLGRRGFVEESTRAGLGTRLCPVGTQDLRYHFLRVREQD